MVIYEVWADVYPLPLPPASPTSVSVQSPVVMGLKPYDALFSPAGPQGYLFVELYVNNVADMFTYEMWLEFDTAVLTPLEAWTYYPWTRQLAPDVLDDTVGEVRLAYGMAAGTPPGEAFTGSSPFARIYFMVDAYGGGGGGGLTAYGGEGGTTDLAFRAGFPESFLGDTGGVEIPCDFYDGWFSGPQCMSYQGSLFPGGDPTGTDWHEIWPDYCKMWHVKEWEDDPDSIDGTLSPSDQIGMTNETGWTYWYHVDEVTTTIHWTFKPDGVNPTGELAAAEPYLPVDWPMGDPTGTYWHQIYGPPPPGAPEGTSGYCRWFSITSFEDTNGNDQFDPSDQFDFQYFDEAGVTYWAHLDDVTTDIIVTQKPIPPEEPILEFPLGIGFIMALAPIIPLIYLWRRKVWKK